MPLPPSALGLSLGLLAAACAAEAAPVRVLSGVPYPAPGPAERLDVYLPASEAGPGGRPAVVYFHGGGWVGGDKAGAREREIGRALASAGYVFVSANYELGRGSWPANLEDCRDAVRFVRSRAAEYGVDPRRIAAMGASAGGHLALLVAFTSAGDRGPASGPYAGVSSSVDAAIDFYGITDLLTRRDVAADGTPLPVLDDGHSAEMLGVGRGPGAALWRAASPVAHVSPASPPVLIAHGLSDPTVDYGQAVELANALRAKRVPHRLVLLEGVGHMFDLVSWRGRPLPVDLRPVVLGFLGEYVKDAAARPAATP